MRAVVTRVSSASVAVNGEITGSIGTGFLVLLGIAPDDDEKTAERLAAKICRTRVFEGELLIVSQFTLYADLKSRRPGFTGAAKPDVAIPLYEKFICLCREEGFHVETGIFGADMKVSSVNDGPVTLIFDTDTL